MTGRIFAGESAHPSRFPGRFDRPRLHKILKAALKIPLVSVVAGQGYGKTYSVYSFLENYSAITIWIQLSERDNAPECYWENVCACIALRNPELGKGLLGIGFPETDQQFDSFYAMVSQATKTLRHSTGDRELQRVLVYDNFGLIQDAATLRFFDRTLAFPIPNTSVILISRNEPRVKTQALLSKGLLFKIAAEDLRFNQEEIVGYFAMRNIKISREDAARLYQDTEGWPQVISLIAQDLTKHSAAEFHYTPELVKIPLFEMIDRSFFSSLDTDTRKFLIKLSLGDHWPLELLNELDETGNMSGDLEKLTPFIRYDSFLNGYRIHTLLIDFLKEKQGELSPAEQREINRKTAAWCLKNNLRMDAAMYYERAQDLGGFLNLTLALPIIIPWEMAVFFLSIVDRLLAEPDFPSDSGSGAEPGTREILWYLRFALRPKLLFALRRFEEAAAVCRQAIAEFEKPRICFMGARVLMTVYLCLGFIEIFISRYTRNYCFLPLFEKAYYYFETYAVVASEGFTQGNVPSYICHVGFPAAKDAFEVYLRAFAPVAPLIAKMGDGHFDGLDTLGHCEYCYYKGDLGTAENFARQALIQARESRQYETENRALFYLLRIAVYGGNLTEIEELFRQLKAQLDVDDYRNRYLLYDIECAWFYTQTGSPALAASWLRNNLEDDERIDFFFPLETLSRARCFFAEGQYQSALELLEQRGSGNTLESYFLGKLEKTVLAAACDLRLGDRRAAVKKLEEAWEISAIGDFDMPFIEMGEDMRNLASVALNDMAEFTTAESEKTPKCRIPPEWLESVRNRAAAYSKMTVLAAAHGPKQSQQFSGTEIILRRRELLVLTALSRGLTREDIARRERISFNGVKEIIKNLYHKLGAVNRADAVRIANDRGLLKNFRR
jgi:LuxR family maltose regulon positive regulatory protein